MNNNQFLSTILSFVLFFSGCSLIEQNDFIKTEEIGIVNNKKVVYSLYPKLAQVLSEASLETQKQEQVSRLALSNYQSSELKHTEVWRLPTCKKAQVTLRLTLAPANASK